MQKDSPKKASYLFILNECEGAGPQLMSRPSARLVDRLRQAATLRHDDVSNCYQIQLTSDNIQYSPSYKFR